MLCDIYATICDIYASHAQKMQVIATFMQVDYYYSSYFCIRNGVHIWSTLLLN
jgi:hypothetical protein